MAPRKDKHIMINDESENSSAATKRRRIHEVVNGVPITNPTTEEHPSIHLRNPPRNTTSIDLQLEEEEGDADDDILSSVISQQNFLISYHMSEMQVSVEEVWRRNLSEVVKQRKEMEAKLKEKEEEVGRFKKMCYFYHDRVFLLEEKLQRMRRAGEGCSAAAAAAGTGVEEEEEVESRYVERMHLHLACLSCLNRAATMVWLPCRHLCVCLVCDRRRKCCPVCGAKKTESVMINNLP